MRPGNDDAADSGQSRGARAKQNDQQRDGSHNAAAAQRARILAHLQAGKPLTTIQGRPPRMRFTATLWRVACSCKVSGRCPVCLEWHRRLRLREVVAQQITRGS
ncbi:hypothetical protein GALL_259610 [mine drainage metagenome]|uniref:Uncharacterized protein n=1 Tax=mine drainage metagenome TaxID=410659 RepID=A0A1J5RJ48_9ZZZZ